MTTITKTNPMKAVEGLVRDLEFSRRHNESEEVKGLSLCYITRQMRPYVMRAQKGTVLCNQTPSYCMCSRTTVFHCGLNIKYSTQ